MRIGTIIINKESPTVRYRMYKYLPFLEKQGITPHFFVLPKNILQRYLLFWKLRNYDLVLIIKKLLAPWEIKFLNRICRRIIFDFDDAIFFKDNLEKYYSLKRKIYFSFMVKHSDYIICGNELLKLFSFTYNRKITVLPTSIDIDDYLTVENNRSRDKKFTIGWIGTSGSLKYLEAIRPALEKIGKKIDIRLKVICDDFIDFKNIEVEKVLWSEDSELDDLVSVDLGIMPLPDTPYSTGKCAFKIVQYFGLKLPVIASPVGVNRELVKPYISGLFASSQEEWEQGILYCYQNRQIIKMWGENALKIIQHGYTVQSNAPKMINLFEKAIQK